MESRVIDGVNVKGYLQCNGGGFVAETAFVEPTVFVGKEAQVSGEARVSGQARVSGEARVFGQAQVSGEARVYGEAWVTGKTCIPHRFNGATFTCNSHIVTVNEDFIQIGCYAKTIDEWLIMTPNDAIDLGLPQIYHAQYRAFLEMIKDFNTKDSHERTIK